MTYCRKIRFYPTNQQLKYFKQFFGANRYLYNKTISYIQNRDKTEKLSLSLSVIRPKIMKNNKDLEDNDPEVWLKNIPYDTRQLAIKNALSSVKSSLELLKNKNITHFKHKFKSKKDNKQVFYVDHRALCNLNLFPNLMKENCKLNVKNRYKKYEKYIPTNDLIISKDGDKYFILFTKEKKLKKIDQKNNILSLDPGIKKFQSFYSPDGYSGEFGNSELKNKVMNIEKRIDKLKSLMKKNKNKMKKKCYKLKTKVKNIILNFHWKISNFLTKNYKNILLPVFKTQNLKNNLNKSNNRLLDIYSHYKFQQKMLYQGKKFGCNVRIVEEDYTTKTCGNCGNINNFVGNSNVFWCPCCKIEMDRDYQAARNILLKNT
jgi:IS605 OrfB family transposase